MPKSWNGDSPKFSDGLECPYTAELVERLRGPVRIEHTLARLGAERLWSCWPRRDYVAALGALTGGQAVQMAKAGLKAIYLSGWQVAADANLAGQTYPDQSLYPGEQRSGARQAASTTLCMRADQIDDAEGQDGTTGSLPILADAEAGFGGPLNAFELMKAMIEAGAAGVHFEDQLASEKKCGHLGGKVLVPTSQFVRTLIAARLAADVAACRRWSSRARTRSARRCSRATSTTPTASSSTGERTPEGFFRVSAGIERRLPAPSPTRRTRTCSGSRPPRRTWARRASSPRRSTSASRASCSPTTARRRSTGGSSLDDAADRDASSRSSASSATASSSSRSPASTR